MPTTPGNPNQCTTVQVCCANLLGVQAAPSLCRLHSRNPPNQLQLGFSGPTSLSTGCLNKQTYVVRNCGSQRGDEPWLGGCGRRGAPNPSQVRVPQGPNFWVVSPGGTVHSTRYVAAVRTSMSPKDADHVPDVLGIRCRTSLGLQWCRVSVV